MSFFFFLFGCLLGTVGIQVLSPIFQQQGPYANDDRFCTNRYFPKWIFWLLSLFYGWLFWYAWCQFEQMEAVLAFIWLTSAFLLSLGDSMTLHVDPYLLYPSHIIIAICHWWMGESIHWLSLLILLPLVCFVWLGKMGDGDLLLLLGWTIWLQPIEVIFLFLFASASGIGFFFYKQNIRKKALTYLPFVPFLSLGLLLVRFTKLFDGFSSLQWRIHQ
ncbi:leader peptidase (prepilin peptidase)/N-methyltransferase [Enterococcus sp. DIV0876]